MYPYIHSAVTLIVLSIADVLQSAPETSVGEIESHCTFSTNMFGYAVPDALLCMYSQNLFSNTARWYVAGSDTDTADTGPTTDHGGRGYYAYIDSSNKDPGSYARLTSPSYTKPASDTGGCVQFYYHMYGEDIGTLNVSVYDNTQAAPVASWQKSGNQGNHWWRADLDLNLLQTSSDLTQQVVITAYTAGVYEENNKGDIAIDDITIYGSGSCPYSSEISVNDTTGLTSCSLSSPVWEASWDADNSSLTSCDVTSEGFALMSNTSGIMTNHYIQTNATAKTRDENSTFSYAYLTTSHFAIQYACLSIDYLVSEVDSNDWPAYIRVSTDQSGMWTPVWNLTKNSTGFQYNSWITETVRIPVGSVKLRIMATVGEGNSQPIIAIDNIRLTLNECQDEKTKNDSAGEITPGGTELVLACNFDGLRQNFCNFYQDKSDDFDWSRASGSTITAGTGPEADHTLGTSQGHYLVAHSSYGRAGDKARIISGLLDIEGDGIVCVRFYYNMYGDQMGTFNVYVKDAKGLLLKTFSISGDQGQQWHEAVMDITTNSSAFFLTFESELAYGTTWSQVRGEISLDDVIVARNTSCAQLNTSHVETDITVPTTARLRMTTDVPDDLNTTERTTQNIIHTEILTNGSASPETQQSQNVTQATTANMNSTVQYHPLQSHREDNSISDITLAVGVAVSGTVVILIVTIVVLMVMKYKRLWMFSPDSKFGIKFGRYKAGDTAQLYDINENNKESAGPEGAVKEEITEPTDGNTSAISQNDMTTNGDCDKTNQV